MHGFGRGRRWVALGVLALMVAVGLTVGFAAYNAGVSHGLAIAAQSAAVERAVQPGAPAPVVGHGYHGYGWHPWGFGFFFGPFLFILFWFVVIRALFFRAFWWGGGPWRRYGYGYGYRSRGCHPYGRMRDEPPVHM